MGSEGMISLDTARALVARGWSIVPTESDGEKRPKAKFETAKSWRDFSDRLPTDAELVGWFGAKPRRGGVVLHKGQLCIDHDTKDGMPPPNTIMWEESAKGWHEFYRCDENAKIAHDHERKIDYLTYGSFVRLCQPECLIDWRGEIPVWNSCELGVESCEFEGKVGVGDKSKDSALPLQLETPTLLATLKAAGWKVGAKAANGWFSLTNGTKTAALSADGSTFKMFSTTLWEEASAEKPERDAPAIMSFDALKTGYPEVPPPLIDGLLRRGETMLVFGKPKVQKSLRMLSLASAVAQGGTWAGFRCEKARVLVIDNETHPAILADRYAKICAHGENARAGRPLAQSELAQSEALSQVDFLPVWDRDYTVEDMMRDAPHLKGYGLIIFDILARGLPDWCESESDNRQCAKVWACVQKTAALTGAAVIVVHHARKSTTADIVSDPSGAGWTRYASTIASLAKKAKEPGVWLEAVCRSFASPQPRRL